MFTLLDQVAVSRKKLNTKTFPSNEIGKNMKQIFVNSFIPTSVAEKQTTWLNKTRCFWEWIQLKADYWPPQGSGGFKGVIDYTTPSWPFFLFPFFPFVSHCSDFKELRSPFELLFHFVTRQAQLVPDFFFLWILLGMDMIYMLSGSGRNAMLPFNIKKDKRVKEVWYQLKEGESEILKNLNENVNGNPCIESW